MDIIAESLSAGTLKAKDVTVNGKKIIDWFESKLSASVSFVGVFENLDDAPKKNGAVAIVGSKDYIYSQNAEKWQEFGDEGQIGVLTQAIADLSNNLSCFDKLDELSNLNGLSNFISAESDPVFSSLSGTFLTAHQSLSNYYQKSETSSALEIAAVLSNVVHSEIDPVFKEMSSNFLTSHQSLSDYYLKTSTSSAIEISTALLSKQPKGNYLEEENDPVFREMSSSFLTEHQSLAGYATEEWVTSKKYISSYTIPNTYKTYNATLSSLSGNGYATQKMLQDALGNIEAIISSL